ncbi:3-phosphoshikimate 1-carboxyvinyltransferase, partial [human gut metagenome]
MTIKGHGTAGGFVTVTRPVFCNESGSTLRFMIPLFSLTAQKVRFTGAGRLFDRPQAIYQMLFERQGLQFEQTPEGITIFGRLRPGGFTLPGDVSSQFISGLLFAAPL